MEEPYMLQQYILQMEMETVSKVDTPRHFHIKSW